jgi:flagellar hook-basal body complex protein FliE
MSEITSLIQQVAPVTPLEAPGAQNRTAGDFRSVLNSALSTVENSQRAADQAVQGFLNGTGGELHSAVLETQRAELQLQLFLQVRNKVLGAFQEIMRSQV